MEYGFNVSSRDRPPFVLVTALEAALRSVQSGGATSFAYGLLLLNPSAGFHYERLSPFSEQTAAFVAIHSPYVKLIRLKKLKNPYS